MIKKIIRRLFGKESFWEKDIPVSQQDSETWNIVNEAEKLGIPMESVNIFGPDDPNYLIPGNGKRAEYLRSLQREIRDIKKNKREIWLWLIAIAGFLMSLYNLFGSR